MLQFVLLESLVHPEHKVGHVDLVPARLFMDDLIIIKNLQLELPQLTELVQRSAILHQPHIDLRHSMIHRRRKNLLLKDDSILERHISVGILDRLTPNNLSELESLCIRQHLQLNLPFSCVVGHGTFNNQQVAVLVRRQFAIVDLRRIKRDGFSPRIVRLVDDLQAEIVEQVFVGAVHSQREDQVLGYGELVPGEEVVAALDLG